MFFEMFFQKLMIYEVDAQSYVVVDDISDVFRCVKSSLVCFLLGIVRTINNSININMRV